VKGAGRGLSHFVYPAPAHSASPIFARKLLIPENNLFSPTGYSTMRPASITSAKNAFFKRN
jgi:hypothetical protein